MTRWKQEIGSHGAGVMPSGNVVSDGYRIEQDTDSESRWRFTYEVDGKAVTHTFDMGLRWRTKHGPSPLAELWDERAARIRGSKRPTEET